MHRWTGTQPSRDLASRLERQQEALLAISRLWRRYEADLEGAMRVITETATRALEIERASVWLLDRARRSILCKDLFEAGPRRHSRGAELRAEDFPAYFEAMAREEVIAAENAREDPRTREFGESYLAPHGIGAMLDAPIRAGGKLVGVLCHEHVGGPRRFSADELNTATYLANLVAAAMELEHRKRSEARASHALSLLRTAFDAAGAALLATDPRDAVVEHNRVVAELWRLPDALLDGSGDPEELARHMAAQTTEPDRFLARAAAVASAPDGESRDVFRLRDGRVLECTSQPQLLEGAVVGRVWAFRDITHQHEMEEQLRALSYRDPLTGLYNRRRIGEILEEELLRARRFALPLSVALLDIDRFKRINDAHGHPVGDQVLRTLAGELSERLRGTDSVGRWGGEEFLILLLGTTLEDARKLADGLRQEIGRPREGLPSFTFSVGVAEARSGESAGDLVARADARLYEAKRAGRNRVAA